MGKLGVLFLWLLFFFNSILHEMRTENFYFWKTSTHWSPWLSDFTFWCRTTMCHPFKLLCLYPANSQNETHFITVVIRLHFLMQNNHVVPPIKLLCLYLANSRNSTNVSPRFFKKEYINKCHDNFFDNCSYMQFLPSLWNHALTCSMRHFHFCQL